jgi:hypothetical protein
LYKAAALALLCAVITAPSSSVAADGRAGEGKATTSDKDVEIRLPAPLAPHDIALYRQIFTLNEAGSWDGVDELIVQLKDNVLVGHVMAERFLHPSLYASRLDETAAWLAEYGDHPDTRRIEALRSRQLAEIALQEKRARALAQLEAKRARAAQARAKSRDEAQVHTVAARSTGAKGAAPKRASVPAAATKGKAPPAAVAKPTPARPAAVKAGSSGKPAAKPPAPQRPTAAGKRSIRAELHPAGLYLASLGDGGRLGGSGIDTLRRIDDPSIHGNPLVLAAWGDEGPDAAADGWLMTAPVDAIWWKGLEAWQAGSYAPAARLFEGLAHRADASPWMVSAAAFWAARAYLFDRQPQHVTALLQSAGERPRTFYGLLARRILGLPMPFSWTKSKDDQAAVNEFGRSTAGKRTFALLQIGEIDHAEQELDVLLGRSGTEAARGIMVTAEVAGFADVAMRALRTAYPGGGGPDSAAYPVPRWVPEEGFHIDRSLVYALMRQESRFNAEAVSPKGARGIMQLMPDTARFVASFSGYPSQDAARLDDPSVNLTLGQRYIQFLMSEQSVDRDLFRFAVAWNGGPGKLERWNREINSPTDPLLFIETIPARETRNFIEQILANFWIYRHRMGKTSPSLDSLASGAWPTYQEFDQPVRVADHGEN